MRVLRPPPVGAADSGSSAAREASGSTESEVTGILEARISSVGRHLTGHLNEMMLALPGGARRATDISASLGLKKDLCARVFNAVRQSDPLTAMYTMPGPEALRTLLRAAREKGVAQQSLDPVAEAIRMYEDLIRDTGGDRSCLDAIISEWLPHARLKFEMSNKQAAFKANSNLKGVMSELSLLSTVVHPAEAPDVLDLVFLSGTFGLRRLRPGAVVQFIYQNLDPTKRDETPLTLDGREVDGMDGLVLPQFSSSPESVIDVRRHDDAVDYVLGGGGVGPDSAVDLVFAEIVRGGLRRYQPAAGHRVAGAGATIEQPTKMLVFDMLLHDDAWPGSDVELRIYDTILRGVVNPNDPARRIDRMDFAESIQSLGRGFSRFRAPEVPNYLEMLRHVFEKTGWDAERFRGYRCRIQYPFYGSQVCMDFDPPPAPTSGR